jgi:hypothetical protein
LQEGNQLFQRQFFAIAWPLLSSFGFARLFATHLKLVYPDNNE